MRIADRTTARNYLKYLNKAKSDYAKTNERIASGNRFVKLSDDVSSGTRVLRVRTDLFKAEKHLDNVKSINDELSSAEDALTSINDVLNEIHGTKLVKAMQETTGDSGRTAIANEIKAMRDEILSFANVKFGKKYCLGGSNASSFAPFTATSDGKMLYNGINVDDIQQRTDGSYFYLKTGIETDIPMDEDVFMDIGLGTKISGADLDSKSGFLVSFSGLKTMGFGQNSGGISNNVYNVLTNIENSLRNYNASDLKKLDTQLVELTDEFRSNLTDIGAKTNYLDTIQTRLTNNIDSYKSRINDLMGVDDAEEASNLTMNDYTLKAILQMGSRILPSSLMDFLK